jgi:putative endonuclease
MLQRLSALFRRDPRTARRKLGDRGEQVAADYLRACGFRIVATNVEVPLGQSRSGRAVSGEIDLIAYDGATLAFVEVKTRRREGALATERAVDARKRRLLIRAAARYRRLMGVAGEPYRFDVAAVLLADGERPVVRLRRAYFTDRQALG